MGQQSIHNKSSDSERMKFIDRLSWPMIIIMGGFLAIAPYPGAPMPHSIEKIYM